MNSYAKDYKDPRWQKRRLEILERDKWECSNCGDKSTQLHVNHRFYSDNRKPWDYEDDELDTLCAPCHEKSTEQQRQLRRALCRACDLEKVLGFTFGVTGVEITAEEFSDLGIEGMVSFCSGALLFNIRAQGAVVAEFGTMEKAAISWAELCREHKEPVSGDNFCTFIGSYEAQKSELG